MLELVSILRELENQKMLEDISVQKNRWNFIAATIVNGFNILSSTIVRVFGGPRRKPKMVYPDDFLSDEGKALFKELSGGNSKPRKKQRDWDAHIDDARSKGLYLPTSFDLGHEGGDVCG